MPRKRSERIYNKLTAVVTSGKRSGIQIWWSKGDLNLTFSACMFFKKGKHPHVFSKVDKERKTFKHRKNKTMEMELRVTRGE